MRPIIRRKPGVFPYRPDVGLETEPITSRICWALSADSRQCSEPGQGLVPSPAGNSQTHRALTICSRKNVQAAFTRLPRLNPTIRPFSGQRIRNKPGDGGPGGLPKGEAQGIPEKPAAFTGAGRRPISRGNANALAAKGNAGENHGAGGVIGIGGNPQPGTAGRGLVAQPVGKGGDLGGGVEALPQFGGGLGRERTSRAAD